MASRRKTQSLHGDIGASGGDQPTGDAFDSGNGPEELGIDAHRHDVKPVERYAVVPVDVLLRRFGDGHHPRQTSGDLRLHSGEGIPPALTELLPQRACVLDLDLAIDGDGMVDGPRVSANPSR